MSVLEVAGAALMSIGVLANVVTAVGLLRSRHHLVAVHVMSIGALAGLLPCLVGAAMLLGDADAIARAVIAVVMTFFTAPFLGQALILRALADGEVRVPRAEPGPRGEP